MKTCLIVDESPVIRKIAARILDQGGFAAEPLDSHVSALAVVAEKGAPEVVIISASGADPAGTELVRAIRASVGGNATFIVATIVEANLGLLTRLKRAGVDEIVYKPFDRARLLHSLAAVATERAAA